MQCVVCQCWCGDPHEVSLAIIYRRLDRIEDEFEDLRVRDSHPCQEIDIRAFREKTWTLSVKDAVLWQEANRKTVTTLRCPGTALPKVVPDVLGSRFLP